MADSSVMVSDNSSIGDAVSGRGDGSSNEDEDLYYIPERRQSLDLGPTPMDTSQWHFVDQALSPAQSYEKLTSEDPGEMADEEGSPTRVQLERADSYSSCYSIDSNDCEKIIPKERSKKDIPETTNELELIQDPEEIKHPSLTLQFTFKALCDTLKKLNTTDLKMFKWKLWTHYPQPFSASQSMDIVDLVDRLLETFSCEMSVQITRTILVNINRKQVAEHLRSLYIKNQVRHELCDLLIEKYSKELITEGETRPLDDIYADLFTFSHSDNGPNIEHEIMEIGKMNTKKKPDKLLSLTETLSQEWLDKTRARQVYLIGVAGSGKSTFVKKLACDWARGRSHQHFSFIFLLTLKEINQYEGSKISLDEIIENLYPVIKKLKMEDLKYDEDETLVIFDGLEDYPKELNFSQTEIFSDSSEPTRLHVVVINLLRGRLLSNARFVLTTRPQADPCGPWDGHFDEIEMDGFSDTSKDEYFKKRFKDPNQAATVIEYVKSMKTLHIMCHLPLFCTLVADECQRIFGDMGTGAKLPRNITYMYTKLLLKLSQVRKTKPQPLTAEGELTLLMELGKLAFAMLENGKYRINSRKWPEISDVEAIPRSGICTQYMITPSVLCHEDMVSFIHPTVQEYMAALYAYLSFRNQDNNIFDQPGKTKFRMSSKGPRIMELYKAAIEKSLQCEDGKLDMFLRFLFGMACKTNQELLQPFLKPSAKIVDLTKDCTSLIKKNQGSQHPDRFRSNLGWCLEELDV